MLICALCVVPIVFAYRIESMWGAVLLIGLAAAAHQGFSANLFTLPSDTFPAQAVGSVVGMGGMAGAIGGMLIAKIVGYTLQWTGSYMVPFLIAGFRIPGGLGGHSVSGPEAGTPANNSLRSAGFTAGGCFQFLGKSFRFSVGRRWLLVDATGQETSVDCQQMAGDKAGGFRRQEYSGAAEFIELPESPHRGAHKELAATVGSVEQCGVQVGSENSWSDRVDTNTGLGPFDGQRFGKRSDCCLAGTVRGNFIERDKEITRRY